jgi:hypothetical protein
MVALNSRVAKIHRNICARNGCDFLATLDYNDPCIGCPAGHFGPFQRRGCNRESVGFLKKAANLVSAGGRVTKAAVKREKIRASPEERERRLAICGVCEFFTGKTCMKCGCHIKFKAKLETEHCPIRKW